MMLRFICKLWYVSLFNAENPGTHTVLDIVQASNSELPHLMFYGPSGAGKKTRVMALLKEIFGAGVDKVRDPESYSTRTSLTRFCDHQMHLEHRTFTTTSSKKVELTTIASNYHIECNPADVGNSDRFVVQEVIKEIASSHPVIQTGPARGFKGIYLI